MRTAETHETGKGDGKRREPGSRNFDHRLQDERGSGIGAETHKPRKGVGKQREQPIAGAARGYWGTGKTGQFQISHCERFDIRLDRRRLRKCRRRGAWPPGVLRTVTRGGKMHEMMKSEPSRIR